MKRTLLTLVMALVLTPSVFGQSKTGRDGAQNSCNPCDGTVAVNPCYAKAGTVFYINDPMGRNSVTTESSAPLEDIVGTTSQITGYVVFDPTDPNKGGKGELFVPVASLNTGIPLRDGHLQSADWLNAEEYPNIALHIHDVKNVRQVKSSKMGTSWDVTIRGDFTLHGHTKEFEIEGRITYLPESNLTKSKTGGNLLAVRAQFNVVLADFDITGPSGSDLIGSMVGETVDVDVRFVASSSKPLAMAQNPCNPCGGNNIATNPCNPCGGNAVDPCNPCGN